MLMYNTHAIVAIVAIDTTPDLDEPGSAQSADRGAEETTRGNAGSREHVEGI